MSHPSPRPLSAALSLLAICLMLPGPAWSQVLHRCASMGLVSWGNCDRHQAAEIAPEPEPAVVEMPCHGPGSGEADSATADAADEEADDCCSAFVTGADDAPVTVSSFAPPPPGPAPALSPLILAVTALPNSATAPPPPIRGPPPRGPRLFIKNASILR